MSLTSTYVRVKSNPLRAAGVLAVSLSLCTLTVTHVVLANKTVLSDADQERVRFIVGTQLYPDTLTANQDFGLQQVALAGQNTGGGVPDTTSLPSTEPARQRVVAQGETLSQIAMEYDLSSYDFLVANPSLPSRDSIKPGMVLDVPVGGATDEQVAAIKADIAAKQKKKLADAKAASKKSASTSKSSKKIAVDDSKSGDYVTPVRYQYVSQHFMEHGHTGVDFVCDVGTTVRAAADGVVIRADALGWNGGYGKVVLIKHSDDSYTTLYGHLSKLLVEEGDSVQAGEAIALSGNSGRSTGPHLHFEVRSGGGYINPLKFIQ